MSEIFEGDVLFFNTNDGGEISIIDGLVKGDCSFSTAVYLSLFGGNKEDSGKIKNNLGWWGNYLIGVPEGEKLVSRFQYMINSLPLTAKNLLSAENAAVEDLKWLKDDGIVDEIIVIGRGTEINQANFTYSLSKSGEKIGSGEFGVQWEAGVSGI